MTDFRQFFLSKGDIERDAYAKEAGCAKLYIETQLIARRKMPRKKLMQGLADASKGALSYDDILNYFYTDNVQTDTLRPKNKRAEQPKRTVKTTKKYKQADIEQVL